MPTIETKYFGPMTFEEQACLDFPSGLPAFERERRFLVIEKADYRPLVFVQSAATPSLCFVALPILAADPAYRLAVNAEDLESLGLAAGRQPRIGSEAVVLTLLSIREDAATTANLMAPLVINLANRRALQAIRCDAVYSHEQMLAPRAEQSPC